MKRPSPRHRFEAVLATVKTSSPPPTGELEQALHAYITRSGTPSATVEYAYDLYLDIQHRPVIDAFILADADRPTVSRVLGIPVSVLMAYEYLFFDMETFRNRLEKISYASNYEGDAYASELLKTGVMVGADYLIWTYGGREAVDTRVVVRHTMIDAFFRGMSHKGNNLTSGVAKEAQKWWATAIRNAEILEKMDPQASKQAHEELKKLFALEGVDETTPVDKAPVPLEDILH
jgi:hypothetical protein